VPAVGAINWQLLLNLLVWVLILLAAARPVFVEKPIERQQPVRDLMLAIDISQSMETEDFTNASGQKINRLAAVKEVVQGFIDKRKDDRLGLIVFGSGAYPQAPLTLDHASLSLLLDDTGIGMAGPNTAIGDAIGLSLKLLDQAHEQEKVLILLTDGNDTSSAITPDHAAAMAAAKGVVIHTIGIGDPTRLRRSQGQPVRALSRLPKPPAASSSAPKTATRWIRSTAPSIKLTPHQVKTLSHQPQARVVLLATGRGDGVAWRCITSARCCDQAPGNCPSAAGGLRWRSTSATSISCAHSGCCWCCSAPCCRCSGAGVVTCNDVCAATSPDICCRIC
jgi:Ca-activated chloride channel family protein